jgi:hypothetical protein
MSKKYVPSFVRNGQVAGGAGEPIGNKFAVFDDDDGKKPAIKPMTMAQATTVQSDTPSQLKKQSYADKFKNNIKNKPEDSGNNDTNVVPVKVADINSADDFPTLGGGGVKKAPIAPVPSKFADLAKNWAQKAKEDEEIEMYLRDEENKRKANEIKFKDGVKLFGGQFGKKKVYNFNDDEGQIEEDEYIGGNDEEYEVPSHEESEASEHEDDELEGEYDERYQDEKLY